MSAHARLDMQQWPRRLLICGWNNILLETRAMILQRAGYDVDVVRSVEEARQLLEQQRGRYALLLACHTIPVDMQDAIEAVASRAETPMHRIDKILFPGDLVREVYRLLRKP